MLIVIDSLDQTTSSAMAISDHPNFPSGLSIRPLVAECGDEEMFDGASQEDAIGEYGIAGRVW